MKCNPYKAGIIISSLQLLLALGLLFAAFYGGIDYILAARLMAVGFTLLASSLASALYLRRTYKERGSGRWGAKSARIRHLEEQNRIYRQRHHDLHNHLTIVSGLAQLGDLGKLTAYLDAYLGHLRKGLFDLASGLKEVDILITAKFSQAREQGVDVHFRGLEPLRCHPDELIAITTILANALDNAIEAAAQIRGGMVELAISGDRDEYFLEISNAYDSRLDLGVILKTKGATTKAAGEGGEGIDIIRRVAGKLKGTVEYSLANGLCRLRVSLPKIPPGKGGRR